jgi:bifunctional DNase/RNase
LTVVGAGLIIEPRSNGMGMPGVGGGRGPAWRAFEHGVGAKGATEVAVQMELTRIIISENNEQQIIFLKEVDGERTFPIVIGIFEATSIDRRVKGLPAPRPLTHDLLASTIDLLGGELQDIFISELRDHTYFAKLRIRHEGELIEVDSRPSDAIAVAVTVDVPIYVSEDVLNEVGQ